MTNDKAPSAIYDALSNIEKFSASEIQKLDNGSEYMKARDVQKVAEQFKAPSAMVDVDVLADDIRGMKFAFSEQEKKSRIEQIARSVESLRGTYTREDMWCIFEKGYNTSTILEKNLYVIALNQPSPNTTNRKESDMSDTIKRMSDEEIIESYFTEKKLEGFKGLDGLVKKAIALDVIGGARLAESILIPQIESLEKASQIERETLNAQIKRHQDEMEQLCDELESLQKENEELKAKYDTLVEGLKGIGRWTVEEMKMRGASGDVVEYKSVKKLLTDNGGKNEV